MYKTQLHRVPGGYKSFNNLLSAPDQPENQPDQADWEWEQTQNKKSGSNWPEYRVPGGYIADDSEQCQTKAEREPAKESIFTLFGVCGYSWFSLLFPSWVLAVRLEVVPVPLIWYLRSPLRNLPEAGDTLFYPAYFCSMQKLLQSFFCFCPALLVQQSGEPVRCNDIFGMFAECPGTPAIQSLF